MVTERGQKGLFEQEVQSLKSELEASYHKEQCLDSSLSSANNSLAHVQELTEQRLELKDAELRQVKSELTELEKRQKVLEQGMLESRQEVGRLERAEHEALQESEELRDELEGWKVKERRIEELSSDRDRLQRKVNIIIARWAWLVTRWVVSYSPHHIATIAGSLWLVTGTSQICSCSFGL